MLELRVTLIYENEKTEKIINHQMIIGGVRFG